MSTLLNIAGKIDPQIVSVFETVNQATTELDMPYVVVGATARDLVLHLGHGAEIQRATRDVDFAIEVPSWTAFETLKNKLFKLGFSETGVQHRLHSPNNYKVDIVPFGGIEGKQATISWPPKGDVRMNVLGFKEACDNAEWVRIKNEPKLDVPVATPAGMMLLKFIAWTDRSSDLRKKDALDIAYLLTTYETIKEVRDALYNDDNSQIMETYDWEITQATAHLLGQHAKSIAQEDTHIEITRLVKGEWGKLNLDRFTEEMCEHTDDQYDKNSQLLSAFMAGFSE